MKIKFYLAALILASTALFTSCTKEGPPGPIGPSGTNGSNGVPNMSSSTFGISTWNSDSFGWYAAYTDSAITPAVQSGGAVEVFFSIDLGTTWFAVPWSIAGVNYTMSFKTQANYFEVDWDYIGPGIGIDPNSYFSRTIYLKIVVIPPGMRKHDVDYSNYAAIKKSYNLNDSFSANSLPVSELRRSRSSFSIN